MKIKNWLRIMAHLGEVCMYCKIGQHYNGCSCCQQKG